MSAILTCDDCKYCDIPVRPVIIDYDTGETMLQGQCRKYIFCYGNLCAQFEPKQKGDQP